MKGLNDPAAAAQEAREEAGVTGRVWAEPIGCYKYRKQAGDDQKLCEVRVYPLEVNCQLETWLEKGQRDCHWFSPAEAVEVIDEPGLRKIVSRASSLLIHQ